MRNSKAAKSEISWWVLHIRMITYKIFYSQETPKTKASMLRYRARNESLKRASTFASNDLTES